MKINQMPLRSFILLSLFPLLAAAAPEISRKADTSATNSVSKEQAEKLFRQKCLRCHDLRMATRPVRPEAADSLVHAMRRYDPRWITTEDVPILVHYVRAYNARRNSPIQSQSKRSTP